MAGNLILVIGAVLLGSTAYGNIASGIDVILLRTSSKCPEQESVARHVLCYYQGRTSLYDINFCNCTHIILTDAVRISDNYTVDLVEGAKRDLEIIKERKRSLTKLFTFNAINANFLESENKSVQVVNEIGNILTNFDLNGVEVNFPLTARDAAPKDSVTSFIKALKKKLENSSRVRVKRAGYDVSENVEDDITTAPYRTPTTKTTRGSEKYQTTKKSPGKRRKIHRGSRYGRREQEEEEEVAKEEKSETRLRRTRKELRENHGYEPSSSLVAVRLPVHPEIIAKKFDVKALSRYADLMVVSTHNITDESEARLTYHPSRLMGLSDMLNADSILDFLSGLGVEKSKIVLTLPATILKFQLEDDKKTTPRSPRSGELEIIDQSQLCSLFGEGNWTVERDDDLTAPYAFNGKTWLAYEDKVSVNIKAKYILLRELAGGGIFPMDADTGRDPCNGTSSDIGYLVNTLYGNFVKLDRKPRGLVLESLQQDIHDTAYSTVEAGIHHSEYRIVRVVDHSGAVHVIRKNTKTQFECSRQGYFSHPLGCNKFYRCVKFNQYTDDFTVFEYDCPAGLAFDERWEVCVWPGSLPHGAPCTGSSEIAPVPRSHYQCPNHEGYYADPENCRWFFACLDHARDGVTPLTAYEFRCPFGLVFNEQNLACDWPWNVGACGNRGFSGVILEHHGGSSSSLHSATFVNAGGIASSFGASSGHQQASLHSGFFDASAGGGHSGSGYIASHFDDNQDKASFATVPDYEVSGGRILNRGGLVLNQNVNFHGVSGDASLQNEQSGTFSHGQSVLHGTYGSARVSEATVAPIVQTDAPAPTITKLTQLVYDPPLSSPRPFSVRVPEVQINQEVESSGAAVIGGSTTPRVETFEFATGVKSGGVSTFGVSSESAEINAFIHGNADFGQKITDFASDDAKKQFEVHVTTPAPVYSSQGVRSGFGEVSHVSASTAGYEFNAGSAAIDSSHVTVVPKKFQQSSFHFADIGSNYRVSSTTPAPNVLVGQNLGVSSAGILVTPQPEVNLYRETGVLHKVSGQSGFYGVSNSSESFIHRPLVEVSTATPLSVHELSGKSSVSSFSGNGAAGFQESRLGSQSLGNAILLEEHVERVVVPKVLPTATPSVSYARPSVSLKSVAFGGTSKATIAPGTTIVTVEPQNFIGPIEISSPAPPPAERTVLEHKVVSAPAPKIVTAAQPVLSVQQNFNQYRASVLQPATSTPAPIGDFRRPELVTGSFDGRTHEQITVVKEVSQPPQSPAVQYPQVLLSTPAPEVYRAPEYLPPVQSKITVQQSAKHFVLPPVRTEIVSPVVSTPAPAIYRRPEYVSGGSTFHQGVVNDVILSKPVVQVQKVSTPAPIVIKRPEHVASGVAVGQGYDTVKTVKTAVQQVHQVLAAPEVYKAPEYLPPVQTGTTISTVQPKVNKFVQTPIVETKIVQPIVSTPAPAVFRGPEFVTSDIAAEQGQSQLKPLQPNIQTYSQVPVVQQVNLLRPVVSTPAPPAYKAPEYLPPVKVNEYRPLVQTKFVQPVVSTPVPVVFRKPEFSGNRVAAEQGSSFKSSFQQSVQTYSQAPVVEQVNFLRPVVSTPAPPAYKAPEYLPPVKVNEYRPLVQTKFVQPVVSTPVPAVFAKPEYAGSGLAVQQKNIQFKSSVQQNVQTYSQAPIIKEVNLVQPVVSTPAPSVYKAPEYLPPAKVSEYRPVVQSGPLPSTPATIFRTPESGVTVGKGAFDGGVTVLKPIIQQVHHVSPQPSVYKAPEYLPPVTDQRAELKSAVQENVQIQLQTPEVKFVQPAVSTPAPAVITVQQSQGARLRQQPIKAQSYNFVSSTSSTPVAYQQKEISVSEYFPQPGYQQDIFRTGVKAKQLAHTVFQPEISVHRQQSRPEVVFYDKSVTTPASFGLKSTSPRPAQVFGYQSVSTPLLEVSTPEPEIIETPVTSKPALVVQQIESEKLSVPISVTQNALEVDRSTSKPYVYNEFVSISSPKPQEVKVNSQNRFRQPIIVTESPRQNILQPILIHEQTSQKKEGQTIYYENFEKSNPVVSALEKEIVQPVQQQETYHVSTEPSLIIREEEEPVDYLPPTGQEIENYSNFEFQKIGKTKTDFGAQNAGVYNSGAQRYESDREDLVTYKVNSKIEIAPPPEEYFLELTPKSITTTAAPLQTTTAYRPRARPTTSTVEYSYDESYETNSRGNKATVISVGQVDDEELEDGNVESLLEKYSGDFGNVLGRDKFVTKIVQGEEKGKIAIGNEEDSSTVGYDVSTSRSRSRGQFKSTYRAEDGTSDDTTVASLDLKNLKIKKNKKTVIIVSQVSDANPLLIGKLAGQCSCQSNKLQFRRKVLKGKRTTTTTAVPPSGDDEATPEDVLDSLAIEAVTPKTSSENVIFIDGSRSAGKSHESKIGRALFTPEEPRRRITGKKGKIGEITGNEIGQALFKPVSAAEIARTEDYAGARSKVAVGASFDRYGPGGLRGFDETLQGSVDCERPGLFRHPKYCNKFYACNYDPWKKRYTLHVFNCPIHLSYDASISACNWPSKGPACSDDHLLV